VLDDLGVVGVGRVAQVLAPDQLEDLELLAPAVDGRHFLAHPIEQSLQPGQQGLGLLDGERLPGHAPSQ
jgi:hypothetical protein